MAAWSHAGGAVVGIESGSGKQLWSHKTPEYTSPLLAHKGRVYFAAKGLGLYGLNLRTGVVEWSAELHDADRFVPLLIRNKPGFWSSEGWMIMVDPEEEEKEEKPAGDAGKKAPGGAKKP